MGQLQCGEAGTAIEMVHRKHPTCDLTLRENPFSWSLPSGFSAREHSVEPRSETGPNNRLPSMFVGSSTDSSATSVSKETIERDQGMGSETGARCMSIIPSQNSTMPPSTLSYFG